MKIFFVLVTVLCLKGVIRAQVEEPQENLGTRIVGGEQANLGLIRHQVSLQRVQGNAHFCGGSLVSLRHVITAAHCFLNREGVLVTTPSLYQVRAGEVNLASRLWQTRRAFNVTTHPQFNPNTLQADIAAVILASAFPETTALAPVAITHQAMLPDIICTISGWGDVRYGANTIQDFLMFTIVPIIDQEVCRQAYSSLVPILDDMVCAGDYNLGRDSCQGDSGGPLTCNNVLTGVVSWGQGCAAYGYYGVYTRIEVYSSWIDRVISGSDHVNSSAIAMLISILCALSYKILY